MFSYMQQISYFAEICQTEYSLNTHHEYTFNSSAMSFIGVVAGKGFDLGAKHTLCLKCTTHDNHKEKSDTNTSELPLSRFYFCMLEDIKICMRMRIRFPLASFVSLSYYWQTLSISMMYSIWGYCEEERGMTVSASLPALQTSPELLLGTYKAKANMVGTVKTSVTFFQLLIIHLK